MTRSGEDKTGEGDTADDGEIDSGVYGDVERDIVGTGEIGSECPRLCP